MQTAKDLFIHEINDILDGERRILEALQQQQQESSRPELKKAFSQHHDQTEGQIERLEQVLEEIDEQPEETECHGIMGLIEEKRAFSEENPSEELVDIFNAAAGMKVERYEITSYEGLIRLAQQLKLREAVRLLQQNLREEQQTLKKLETLSKKLKPSELGIEEEEATRGRGASRSKRRRAA